MLLAHGELLRTLPNPVSMTELGIAVTVIRVALAVFLPQQ